MKIKSKNKILVICGPTATGKTNLGVSLAKKLGGEIISADSRQVYKQMDIGTGKEWGETPIWGYDLVDPKESFSVADFVKFAKKTLEDIWRRKKLAIVVGGTGFYIKALIDGLSTVNIPKNERLREILEKLSVPDLYEKLAVLDSSKAASLNSSDKKNSRRLVRAIEIATWNIENEAEEKSLKSRKLNTDNLFIGLTLPREKFKERIEQRVQQRIDEGFIDEVENLLKSGVSWKNTSMQSLGYKEAEKFFKRGLGYEEFFDSWVANEIKYMKRQITWFKKDKRINWFDVADPDFKQKVVKMVEKWYYSD